MDQRDSFTELVPFDLAVFDQDTVWFDERGRLFRIDAMGRLERRRLARWLRANVRHFYADVLRVQLVRSVLAVGDPEDGVRERSLGDGSAREPGDRGAVGARVGVDAAGAGGLPELVFLSAAQWLEATLLMRRLRRWWWP